MYINIISLFLLIWFGFILAMMAIRGQKAHWLNIAIPSAAATAFAWSQGWLV